MNLIFDQVQQHKGYWDPPPLPPFIHPLISNRSTYQSIHQSSVYPSISHVLTSIHTCTPLLRPHLHPLTRHPIYPFTHLDLLSESFVIEMTHLPKCHSFIQPNPKCCSWKVSERATHAHPNSPYVVIILLVSRKSRIPFGEDTSNCNLWDLERNRAWRHTSNETAVSESERQG